MSIVILTILAIGTKNPKNIIKLHKEVKQDTIKVFVRPVKGK